MSQSSATNKPNRDHMRSQKKSAVNQIVEIIDPAPAV